MKTVPTLNSYADAYAYWDSADTWRGETGEHDMRKARFTRTNPDRRHSVRKLKDGSIAFKLHRTDVTTWHPDNTISIKWWSSQITQTVINMCLPSSVWVDGLAPGRPIMACRSRNAPDGFYQWSWDAPGSAYKIKYGSEPTVLHFNEVTGEWQPDEDSMDDIDIISVDRKRARAVREQYRLGDFKTWIETAIHFKKKHIPDNYNGREMQTGLDPASVAGLLSQPADEWLRFVYYRPWTPTERAPFTRWDDDAWKTPEYHARKIVREVTHAIYVYERVYKCETVKAVDTRRKLESITKHEKQLGLPWNYWRD